MKKIAVVLSLPVMLAFGDAVRFRVENRNNGSIVTGGQKREYILHVPGSYDRRKPSALVISMHGVGGWPHQQMDVSQWNRVADERGFIVVYPSGKEGDGPRHWSEEDVQSISDLIDKLEAEYNIDPARIYANGLSNGGGMSFVLSCTLSDRIAAVGLVGAAHLLPFRWCTDHRAVPMIAFHGTADHLTPYNGGSSWASPRPFPDIPKWTASWARRNRCAAKPVESMVAADVMRREYTDCADHATVVLYTVRGGGHTWPGGHPMPEYFTGPTSMSIDASREMWKFFSEHPLARKTAPAEGPSS